MAESICVCQECGVSMGVFGVGYLGAKDMKDTSCPPVSGMIALCHDCVKGTKYEVEE